MHITMNLIRWGRLQLVALAILIVLPFGANAGESASRLNLAVRDEGQRSSAGKLYVDVSVSAVSDMKSVAVRLSNERRGLTFKSWKQSSDFNGKSFLLPTDENGRRTLFLAAFADEPLTGGSIKLGTIEYDVGARGVPNEIDLQLVVGDLLTADGRVMSLNDVRVEGPPAGRNLNSLGQCYPNPFNPTTTIAYSVASRTRVDLSIYNVKGELVRTLVDEMQDPNGYRVTWDGRDDHGNPVASGTYFYRLNAGGYQNTKKLQLLK